MRRPRRSRSTWAAMTAALLGALAAGCGGGGGGGGAAPTNFNTAEFQANFGLGSINVLSTYSGGFTGTGQTIAVIDTGIDVDHPDLDANIAAASTDIVTSNSAFPAASGRARLGKCVASRGLRLREWGGDVCGPAGAAFPNWSRAWHRARLRAETRSRRRVSGQSDAALPTRPRRGRRTRDHCAVAVQDRVLTA